MNLKHHKFILPASERTSVWIHKKTFKEIKDYACLCDISISEAIERLLKNSLTQSKTSQKG